MSDLATYLDDLLAVLKASAAVGPSALVAARLPAALAVRLSPTDPDLAARVLALDDWHAETLADFVAEAQVLARALGRPRRPAGADAETRADERGFVADGAGQSRSTR